MFVSSSAPLPTNSLAVGPPEIDMAARARDFMASRTGRERVYANTPTAASLWREGHGLAVDANQILQQSETSRQSILIGLELPQLLQDAMLMQEATLAQIQASAPVVTSLNASAATVSPGTTLETSQNGLMPAPAPVQTTGQLWGSGKLPQTGPGQRGIMGVTRGPVKHGHTNLQDLGPGCPASLVVGSPRGGYGPDWGDASASPEGAESPGLNPWIVIGAALAAIGIAGLAGKGRR